MRAIYTMFCWCRGSDDAPIDAAQLRPLSLLEGLTLEYMDIRGFTIPSSWQRLQQLHFARCSSMHVLPANLSALAALTSFKWLNCGDITQSIGFITQLRNLREVCLSTEGPWSAASWCAITQAQLLTRDQPDCQVQLSF